ncbi:MAG: hypothetical protein HYR55_04730 [Acidobacteria bacterium]|nr:hypothetical protein [Acidobacteriota bacterium]MBI3657358.1 hypothetical protein [Acidobacteriota bacterium]
MPLRRTCTRLFCLVLGLTAVTCQPRFSRNDAGEDGAAKKSILETIDAASASAAQFLVKAQSSDGAWRSATYGIMRDGPSLTPLVLSSLFFLPQTREKFQDAFQKGTEYLIALVGSDGSVNGTGGGFPYPVYTAAGASWALALGAPSERHRQAQMAWLAYVKERQLTEALGWEASDPEYGGWGYAIGLPRKTELGSSKNGLAAANLSSTVFALGALRAADTPAADPSYQKILTFVKRCQNYTEDPDEVDHDFDDGGFFFAPNDLIKNKAGLAGKDRLGRRRFSSYGSMTADGVRALRHGGLAADHPRVMAARQWLEQNFAVHTNPGNFSSDREVFRDAYYYYYVWSVSHAFMHLGLREIVTSKGRLLWPAALAAELIARQQANGSWINRYTDAKEDDPLVATPFAAAALAICRRMLVGG